MELIDQVSINALSKRDLLLIIKALEYTNENNPSCSRQNHRPTIADAD